MTILSSIGEATKAGDRAQVAALTRQALAEGIEAGRIIQEGFVPAMDVIGQRFADGACYIPEVLLAARAMQSGMDELESRLVDGAVERVAKVVIGTVQGDLHDIGKNLVGMMLQGAGLEVVDLGVDVPPARFVDAVAAERPRFVALSALLTTTMTSMAETIDALQEAGLRAGVRVLVGGAPITREFADRIGADGYGANAGEAVRAVRALLT